MICRQMSVLIAKVILAKLASDIAVGLEQARDVRILNLHAEISTWQANFRKARSKYALPSDVSDWFQERRRNSAGHGLGRRPSIRRRMLANKPLGTATSANWNVT